jgi:hypothetical protein
VSKLTNADAMQAAVDVGIRFAVTDTSREGCDNPSPNTAFYNAYGPAILLVPRRPTGLSWNVSTPSEWVDRYNDSHRDYWGRDSTYEQVIDQVSDVLIHYLMRGEADPWMFHQANLRAYDGEHSLLGELLDATLAKLAARSRVPVRTPPMEDIGLRFARRVNYQGAGVRATLFRGRALVIDAGRSVSVPVTGVRAADGESYGGDVIGWSRWSRTSTCLPGRRRCRCDGARRDGGPVGEPCRRVATPAHPHPAPPAPPDWSDAGPSTRLTPGPRRHAGHRAWPSEWRWDRGGVSAADGAPAFDDGAGRAVGPLGRRVYVPRVPWSRLQSTSPRTSGAASCRRPGRWFRAGRPRTTMASSTSTGSRSAGPHAGGDDHGITLSPATRPQSLRHLRLGAGAGRWSPANRRSRFTRRRPRPHLRPAWPGGARRCRRPAGAPPPPPPPPPVEEGGVPRNASWWYWDNGGDLGTAWRTSSGGTGWDTGAGPFGYGESYVQTIVSYGPSASSKYITTYFTTAFSVTDPAAVTSMIGEVMYDDGFVVYLNRVEIRRAFMPSGTITASTLATGHETGSRYGTFDWSASPEPAGRRRQHHRGRGPPGGATSGDLTFDLALRLGP